MYETEAGVIVKMTVFIDFPMLTWCGCATHFQSKCQFARYSNHNILPVKCLKQTKFAAAKLRQIDTLSATDNFFFDNMNNNTRLYKLMYFFFNRTCQTYFIDRGKMCIFVQKIDFPVHSCCRCRYLLLHNGLVLFPFQFKRVFVTIDDAVDRLGWINGFCVSTFCYFSPLVSPFCCYSQGSISVS